MKSDILNTFFESEEVRDFLRTIFPKDTLQNKGILSENQPSVIIMANTNKYYEMKSRFVKKSFLIFNELENIEHFFDAEEAFFVPISYIGKRRINNNASYVHSMTFDIDGVTPEHLHTLLYLISSNLVPKPTYITNSGNGVHLYYVFQNPISASISNLKELTKIKYALTDIL